MKKGLGMWIMSKTVMMIFLFSLVAILSMFLSIYGEKIISDTASAQTTLLSETASGVILFESGSNSFFLPDEIQVREANRDYSLVVQRTDDPLKIVFLLAWNNYDTLEELKGDTGFSSANAVVMPPIIREQGDVILFEQDPFNGNFVEVDDNLFITPSKRVDRNDYVLMVRNRDFFCVASKVQGLSLPESIQELSRCCRQGGCP